MKSVAAAVLAAFAALGAVDLVAAGGPRFKLALSEPMRAGLVRLEPGEYDVTFEPAPSGGTHFTAVFFRGGARVATAPAELKQAPAGFRLSDIKDDWVWASFDHKHSRKDGSINQAKFNFQAKTEKAFFEALLTEIGMPEADGASKAPQTLTVGGAPRVAPPANLVPTPTPTPKK